MGNIPCCLRSSSDNHGKDYECRDEYSGRQYVNDSFPRDNSTNFLPHISERELPDEVGDDPSTHPMVEPTFIGRSRSDMKLKDIRRSCYVLDAHCYNKLPRCILKKSNSCSTIFLDNSTISQPDLKNTIKSIAWAIYYHIVNRDRTRPRLMNIFEEQFLPSAIDRSLIEYTADPDHRQIYRFIRTLFHAAELKTECAIITLVYMERLLNYAEIELSSTNWRRIVFCAILVASKVWDDQAVWNVDFCQILRNTSVDDINELERQFLNCLEFNINIPCSVYAKYYYELRALAIWNDLKPMPLPLYKERAERLEAMSSLDSSKKQWMSNLISRRSFSSDKLFSKENCSPVILS